MITTTTTCKLQGRNRCDDVTAAVVAYLKYKLIPSLLPNQAPVQPAFGHFEVSRAVVVKNKYIVGMMSFADFLLTGIVQ